MTLIVIDALLSGMTNGAILVSRVSSSIHHHFLNVMFFPIITENVTFAITKIWRFNKNSIRILIFYMKFLVIELIHVNVVVTLKHILKPLLVVVSVFRFLLS